MAMSLWGAMIECYGLDVHVCEQLTVLCWETMEPLGDGASLEEEDIF